MLLASTKDAVSVLNNYSAGFKGANKIRLPKRMLISMSIVADNVERIIREKGIKKGYVASMAGITAGGLSGMLHGRKNIKAEHVPLLAYALGCSPNELFGFPEPAQPSALRLSNGEPQIQTVIFEAGSCPGSCTIAFMMDSLMPFTRASSSLPL